MGNCCGAPTTVARPNTVKKPDNPFASDFPDGVPANLLERRPPNTEFNGQIASCKMKLFLII